MVPAAWHSVKTIADLHTALVKAQQEHAAMEQALRRSQKMEALGRLTAGVAHDFNNHLTVISSNVEMVALRLDAPRDRLLRHAEAAMQGVRRAAMLTGRLLSFSRHPAPENEAVDVNRLLNGLAELLRRTLCDRIGLDVTLSQQSWFAWADVNQMEQALLSLAVNVRSRVRDGEVLSIAVSNGHLDAMFQATYPSVPQGDYIHITIGDRVDAGRSGRWQLADDLTSADLSMARGFIQAAGGYLLRSDPAADGVRLRLFLPRYVPLALSTVALSCKANEPPTILVVEDDPLVRAACVEVLRGLDYKVLEAPDAMEAFRLIADYGGIDLLFTDLGLPGGVNGRALADAVGNMDAGIRLLFTTGDERADLPDHSQAMLLRKPFSPTQLAAKVRDMLAAEPTVAPFVMVQD